MERGEECFPGGLAALGGVEDQRAGSEVGVDAAEDHRHGIEVVAARGTNVCRCQRW